MNLRGRLYGLYQDVAMKGLSRARRELKATSAARWEQYLCALREHAARHVPFYDGQQDRPFVELVPLGKAQLRREFESLKSDDLTRRRWTLNSSGGATGSPATFIQDEEFTAWSVVTQEFYADRILHARLGLTRTVVLWGSERDLFGERQGIKPRLRNWLTQTTYLNSFRLTDATLGRYADQLHRRPPVVLKGYAGSLYELAKFIHRQHLPAPRPHLIYSSAETLSPAMRELIGTVFGCPVYDFYGSREVGPMAGSCAHGKLHLFAFNNLVEVVGPDNRPVAPGQEGRVLVTTLHNHAMPLIRYDIGDTAVAGKPCACGLPLPTLERISGRVTDHFRKRNGDLVHGEYFTHLFYGQDWVSEFQVRQDDYDLVRIFYTRQAEPPDADLASIEAKIRLVMGPDCVVQWREVTELPRTPQGKRLFTRSLIQESP